MRGTFTQEVDGLIAVTGEWTDDDELIEATRKLRALAVESDDVEARFRAAMDDVHRILAARLAR